MARPAENTGCRDAKRDTPVGRLRAPFVAAICSARGRFGHTDLRIRGEERPAHRIPPACTPIALSCSKGSRTSDNVVLGKWPVSMRIDFCFVARHAFEEVISAT